MRGLFKDITCYWFTWAAGVCTQSLFVVCQCSSVILFIEGDASLTCLTTTLLLLQSISVVHFSPTLFHIQVTKQSRDVISGLVEDKVELSIGLVHFVSFQQAETGSSQQMVLIETTVCSIYLKCKKHNLIYHLLCYFFSYLIIHDDLVCHSIQERSLCDELFLGIFVFLFTCLLDIVSCQCVQTGHLVFFVVSVVEVSINTCCL